MSPKIEDDDDDDESDDEGPHDESSGRKREGSSRLDKKFSAAATVAVMAGILNIYTGVFLVSEQGGLVSKLVQKKIEGISVSKLVQIKFVRIANHIRGWVGLGIQTILIPRPQCIRDGQSAALQRFSAAPLPKPGCTI